MCLLTQLCDPRMCSCVTTYMQLCADRLSSHEKVKAAGGFCFPEWPCFLSPVSYDRPAPSVLLPQEKELMRSTEKAQVVTLCPGGFEEELEDAHSCYSVFMLIF